MSDGTNGTGRVNVPTAEQEDRAWSRRVAVRARGFVGALSAPVWLWSCTFVGARARTLGRPRILNRGRIEIRDDVLIDSRFSRTELVTAPGGRIVIGTGATIEHGTVLVASRLVELGDRVTIGAYCIVSDSDSPDLTAGGAPDDVRPIWIGDEVVMGARVTVLPGAIIGARSQVLSGSMVSGEIPPGVVAGGNPARPLRKLRAAPAPAAVALTPALGLAVDVFPGGQR